MINFHNQDTKKGRIQIQYSIFDDFPVLLFCIESTLGKHWSKLGRKMGVI